MAQMNVDIVFNLKEQGENLGASFKKIVEQADSANQELQKKLSEPINIKCKLDFDSLKLDDFWGKFETIAEKSVTNLFNQLSKSNKIFFDDLGKIVSSSLLNIENILEDFYDDFQGTLEKKIDVVDKAVSKRRGFMAAISKIKSGVNEYLGAIGNTLWNFKDVLEQMKETGILEKLPKTIVSISGFFMSAGLMLFAAALNFITPIITWVKNKMGWNKLTPDEQFQKIQNVNKFLKDTNSDLNNLLYSFAKIMPTIIKIQILTEYFERDTKRIINMIYSFDFSPIQKVLLFIIKMREFLIEISESINKLKSDLIYLTRPMLIKNDKLETSFQKLWQYYTSILGMFQRIGQASESVGKIIVDINQNSILSFFREKVKEQTIQIHLAIDDMSMKNLDSILGINKFLEINVPKINNKIKEFTAFQDATVDIFQTFAKLSTFINKLNVFLEVVNVVSTEQTVQPEKLQNVFDFFKEINNSLNELPKDSFIDWREEQLQALIESFKNISQTIKGIISLGQTLTGVETFHVDPEKIKQASNYFKELPKMANTINEVLDNAGLDSLIMDDIEVVLGIVNKLGKIKLPKDSFIDWREEQLQALIESFKNISQTIKGIISLGQTLTKVDTFEVNVERIKGVEETLKAFSKMANTINKILDKGEKIFSVLDTISLILGILQKLETIRLPKEIAITDEQITALQTFIKELIKFFGSIKRMLAKFSINIDGKDSKIFTLKLSGSKILREIISGMKESEKELFTYLEDLSNGTMEYLPQSPAKRGALVKLHYSGKKVLQEIIEGMKESEKELFAYLEDLSNRTMEYLPQSPAKRGALRNLRRSGRKITEQIFNGINDGAKNDSKKIERIFNDFLTTIEKKAPQKKLTYNVKLLPYDFTSYTNEMSQKIVEAISMGLTVNGGIFKNADNIFSNLKLNDILNLDYFKNNVDLIGEALFYLEKEAIKIKRVFDEYNLTPFLNQIHSINLIANKIKDNAKLTFKNEQLLLPYIKNEVKQISEISSTSSLKLVKNILPDIKKEVVEIGNTTNKQIENARNYFLTFNTDINNALEKIQFGLSLIPILNDISQNISILEQMVISARNKVANEMVLIATIISLGMKAIFIRIFNEYTILESPFFDYIFNRLNYFLAICRGNINFTLEEISKDTIETTDHTLTDVIKIAKRQAERLQEITNSIVIVMPKNKLEKSIQEIFALEEKAEETLGKLLQDKINNISTGLNAQPFKEFFEAIDSASVVIHETTVPALIEECDTLLGKVDATALEIVSETNQLVEEIAKIIREMPLGKTISDLTQLIRNNRDAIQDEVEVLTKNVNNSLAPVAQSLDFFQNVIVAIDNNIKVLAQTCKDALFTINENVNTVKENINGIDETTNKLTQLKNVLAEINKLDINEDLRDSFENLSQNIDQMHSAISDLPGTISESNETLVPFVKDTLVPIEKTFKNIRISDNFLNNITRLNEILYTMSYNLNNDTIPELTEKLQNLFYVVTSYNTSGLESFNNSLEKLSNTNTKALSPIVTQLKELQKIRIDNSLASLAKSLFASKGGIKLEEISNALTVVNDKLTPTANGIKVVKEALANANILEQLKAIRSEYKKFLINIATLGSNLAQKMGEHNSAILEKLNAVRNEYKKFILNIEWLGYKTFQTMENYNSSIVTNFTGTVEVAKRQVERLQQIVNSVEIVMPKNKLEKSIQEIFALEEKAEETLGKLLQDKINSISAGLNAQPFEEFFKAIDSASVVIHETTVPALIEECDKLLGKTDSTSVAIIEETNKLVDEIAKIIREMPLATALQEKVLVIQGYKRTIGDEVNGLVNGLINTITNTIKTIPLANITKLISKNRDAIQDEVRVLAFNVNNSLKPVAQAMDFFQNVIVAIGNNIKVLAQTIKELEEPLGKIAKLKDVTATINKPQEIITEKLNTVSNSVSNTTELENKIKELEKKIVAQNIEIETFKKTITDLSKKQIDSTSYYIASVKDYSLDVSKNLLNGLDAIGQINSISISGMEKIQNFFKEQEEIFKQNYDMFMRNLGYLRKQDEEYNNFLKYYNETKSKIIYNRIPGTRRQFGWDYAENLISDETAEKIAIAIKDFFDNVLVNTTGYMLFFMSNIEYLENKLGTAWALGLITSFVTNFIKRKYWDEAVKKYHIPGILADIIGGLINPRLITGTFDKANELFGERGNSNKEYVQDIQQDLKNWRNGFLGKKIFNILKMWVGIKTGIKKIFFNILKKERLLDYNPIGTTNDGIFDIIIPPISSDVINKKLLIVKQSGEKVGYQFANGIKKSSKEVSKSVETVAKEAMDYVPQSPAKKGPFKKLTYSGTQITKQIGNGIQKSSDEVSTALIKVANSAEKTIREKKWTNIFKGAWGKFSSSDVVKTIKNIIDKIVPVVLGKIRTALRLIVKDGTKFLFKQYVSMLKSVFIKFPLHLGKTALSSAMHGLANTVGGMFNKVLSRNFITFIPNLAKNIYNQVKGVISKIESWFNSKILATIKKASDVARYSARVGIPTETLSTLDVALSKTGSSLQDISYAIISMKEKISTAVTPEDLVKLNKYGINLQKIRESAKPINETLYQLADAVKRFGRTKEINQLLSMFSIYNTSNAVNFLTKGREEVEKTINELEKNSLYIKSNYAQTADKIIGLVEEFKKIYEMLYHSFFENIVDILYGKMTNIRNLFLKSIPTIEKFIKHISDYIIDIVEYVDKFIFDFVNNPAQALEKLYNDVKLYAKRFFQFIISTVIELIDPKEIVSFIVSIAKQAYKNIIDEFVDIDSVVKFILKIVGLFFLYVYEGLLRTYKVVSDYLKDKANVSKILRFAHKVLDFVLPVLTEGFITVAQEIIDFVTSHLRNEETLGLIYYLVKEFGKALVKILINIVATILKILTRGLIDLLTTVTNTIFDWLPEKIKGLFDVNYKRKNDLTEERKKLQNEFDSNLNILSGNTRRLEYDAYAPKDILKKENNKLRERNDEIRLRLIVIDDVLQEIEQKINFEKAEQKTDDFIKSYDKYINEITDSFTSLFQEEQHQQEQRQQEQHQQEEHHQEQQEQQEKIFNVTKALKDIGNKIVDKEKEIKKELEKTVAQPKSNDKTGKEKTPQEINQKEIDALNRFKIKKLSDFLTNSKAVQPFEAMQLKFSSLMAKSEDDFEKTTDEIKDIFKEDLDEMYSMLEKYGIKSEDLFKKIKNNALKENIKNTFSSLSEGENNEKNITGAIRTIKGYPDIKEQIDNTEKMLKDYVEKLNLKQEEEIKFISYIEEESVQATERIIRNAFHGIAQFMVDATSSLATTFENMYELSNESMKEMFYAAKAMAIAESIVNTYLAASKAYAEGGPYAGPILAALAIAQGATNTAKIVQTMIEGPSSSSAGYATGGEVTGPSGTDVIPANLTAGEFVQPVSTVSKYGTDFMEALRRRLIPTDQIRSLMDNIHSASNPRISSSGFFADGGMPAKRQAETAQQPVNIVNCVDTREFTRYLATADGQKAILNVMGSHRNQVKRMLK